MTGHTSRRSGTSGARALSILALLFFIAGLSRLGLGVVEVFAAENETLPPLERAETDRLLAALKAREEQVRQKETEMAQRQQTLEKAEQNIRDQLAALAAAEAQLLKTLSLTEAAAENDVARLVTVYENMKPKQAAELFAKMDVTFAAGFFARLRPDFAGAVMAEMDPTSAYAISAVLAGRHAGTPKN